jgi:TPR repeat protein
MLTSFTKVATLLIAAHLIFSQISAIAFSAKEWASLLDEAKKGDVEAQWTLGCIYADGLHRPKNDAEAVKWTRKAAAQGHTDAQISLATIYELGIGVPKNAVEAYAIFNIVGNKDALESRDRIAKKMTPEQIAGAKKRTKELEKEFKK